MNKAIKYTLIPFTRNVLKLCVLVSFRLDRHLFGRHPASAIAISHADINTEYFCFDPIRMIAKTSSADTQASTQYRQHKHQRWFAQIIDIAINHRTSNCPKDGR